MIKKVLFSLLKSELKGEELPKNLLEQFDEDGLKELFRLAKKHDVEHLIADALLKNGLVSEELSVYKALEKARFLAIMRYEKLNLMLTEVGELFDENGISYLPLKGSVLREYYPEPWMRTSCDTDILIRKEDLERADKLLVENLGYEKKSQTFHDWGYETYNGMHLELHYNMIEGDMVKAVDNILDEVWKYSSVTDGSRYVLTNEMFYYYHIAHMAKHFVHGGTGIRSFLDVYVLRDKFAFNEEKLNEFLTVGGIGEFEKEVESLTNVWFNDKEYTELDLQTEEYVINGGVYGNLENRVAVQQNFKGGKFKYFFSRIFLSFKSLSGVYPILNKHKWLFPFLQVARWFRAIFVGRLNVAIKEISLNNNADKGKMDAMEDFLNKLDLK